MTIPHKEMCNRRFVLDPLIEIDPNIIHPVNKISIKEILNSLESNQKIQNKDIILQNPAHSVSINNYNYIAIEGNIGSGKQAYQN